MLDTFFNFYFVVLLLGIILSFISYKNGERKSIFLFMVLIATLLIEISTLLLHQKGIKRYDFVIHIFNLVEYTLFCLYYLQACNKNRLKFWIKLSIPLFILFALSLSFFTYHFSDLPVVNIDLEGFLLVIIYTHLLFNLDIDETKFVFTHPDFWISTGLLIFYGGVFIFLGLYPILSHIDPKAAYEQYGFVIRPLDIIFYNCIIIGLICSIRNKKYLLQ